MGRIIDKRVLGFRCEVRSCATRFLTLPKSADVQWEDQISDLLQMVENGWAVVLNARIRSYCPEHADRVYHCSCATNPHRPQTCVEHNEESASNVWVSGDMPRIVAEELTSLGVMK